MLLGLSPISNENFLLFSSLLQGCFVYSIATANIQVREAIANSFAEDNVNPYIRNATANTNGKHILLKHGLS